MPVTPGLNADIAGFLPVHCIYQLLKSRAFSKHRVPIKTWVYRQLCESRPPLHPLLPSLVEVYVSSILTFTPSKNQQNQSGSVGSMDLGHDPISEEEIRAIFANSFSRNAGRTSLGGQEHSVTAQLLLLYYALLYEDTRLTQVKSYLQAGINIKAYSQSFFAELPIRYLISQAEKEQHLYAGKLWLSFCSFQVYLFIVSLSIQDCFPRCFDFWLHTFLSCAWLKIGCTKLVTVVSLRCAVHMDPFHLVHLRLSVKVIQFVLYTFI